MAVVAILPGHLANSGLHLDPDEGQVVLDIIEGLGGLLDTPDDVGGNLDGIAPAVIHLEGLTGHVADPQGNFASGHPEGQPAQADSPVRTGVAAKGSRDDPLVGLDGVETDEDQ
jgi:hypothetical protein